MTFNLSNANQNILTIFNQITKLWENIKGCLD